MIEHERRWKESTNMKVNKVRVNTYFGIFSVQCKADLRIWIYLIIFIRRNPRILVTKIYFIDIYYYYYFLLERKSIKVFELQIMMFFFNFILHRNVQWGLL